MLNKSILPLSLCLTITAQAEPKRPNVIYIFPDQFRNHALQFWNEPGFKEQVNFTPDPVFTPNLNRFAQESVVLSQAQSNCPLSSPHRGMLLTGMYPDGSGVPLNCNSNRPISSLRPEAITLGDIFSNAGYNCGYIGKLHLDFPTPNDPQNLGSYVEVASPVWDAYTPPEGRHGFDFWYSYGTYDVHKAPHYWDTEGNRHEIREWSPKHEADKAIAYIQNQTGERDNNKPFFLMVSMNPPHNPYSSLNDVMEEDYNLYKDSPVNQLLIRPNVDLQRPKAKLAPYYFAAITGVDREFGRILDALKEAGADENTIVVFSSDHGETMCSHGTDDPKNSPFAEAMNVPFLIRYPQMLKPHVNNLLLGTPDILPTLLGVVGLADEIPATVQGANHAIHLTTPFNRMARPQGLLYLRNVDGNKDEEGMVLDYFAISRGIKTADYTLAITLDRTTGTIASTHLFHDKQDTYQLNNLPFNPKGEVEQQLLKQLSQLLQRADDPWFRNRTLAEIIPYP